MSRYIDLDDKRVIFCHWDAWYGNYNIPRNMLLEDVVEVVRCKDCKHYKVPKRYPVKYCTRGALVKTSSTDFCSFGERRKDAT